jgi:hypothetical protein
MFVAALQLCGPSERLPSHPETARTLPCPWRAVMLRWEAVHLARMVYGIAVAAGLAHLR